MDHSEDSEQSEDLEERVFEGRDSDDSDSEESFFEEEEKPYRSPLRPLSYILLPTLPTPRITPQAFFVKRKLPLACYFSLTLNFSFPVLEALLSFWDREEELVLSRYKKGNESITLASIAAERKTGQVETRFQDVPVLGRWVHFPGKILIGLEDEPVVIDSHSIHPKLSKDSNSWFFFITAYGSKVCQINGSFVPGRHLAIHKSLFIEQDEIRPSDNRSLNVWCIAAHAKVKHHKELRW